MTSRGFDKFVWNDFEQPKAGPEGGKYMDVFRSPSQQMLSAYYR